MKEQVLLYGVCAAISVAAVAITSMAKLIVCAIAKRYGKNVSGNVKEYVFTPIALLLAAVPTDAEDGDGDYPCYSKKNQSRADHRCR